MACGNEDIRADAADELMGFPEGKRQLEAKASPEFPGPEILPPPALTDGGLEGTNCHDSLSAYVAEDVLDRLPNDLTRMIYLASLRDCNSGLYLHSELSQQRGLHAADRALRACHEQVFRRLLTTRLPEYVRQLHEYIRYTRGETITVLKTWRSLQAYRATVPVGAMPISAELFFLNISVALEILSGEVPELRGS